jgi:integrase
MPIHRRQDSGAWEVVIPQPGRTPLRKSSKHWTRADALAQERSLSATSYTIEAGLDRWLEEYVPYLRNGSSGDYRNKAEQLRPLIRGTPFADAPTVLAKARAQWKKLKPATINRRLAILRRVCNLAFSEWHWIDTPIGQKIKLLPEHNERHYYLTRAEVEAIRMRCIDHEAGQLIVLASFTGLRMSELLAVTRHDQHDGYLRLNARTKNGRPRSIPLHPRAQYIVAQLPFVITPSRLRREWETARDATGLHHIHWHDLRHTFASWVLQAGGSLAELKELMGHTTINQTMRYAHLAPTHLRDAVLRI